MPIASKIEYRPYEQFRLDAKNPRLGREHTSKDLSQEQVLKLMEHWTLDELAVSFLESGFWPQEALIVVDEPSKTDKRLVVVEGNRRLAALIQLHRARAGKPLSDKWAEIAKSGTAKQFAALEQVPYVQADTRRGVDAYLGFRHVTGIKEWDPAEKAEYIASLIDGQNMTYEEVRRKIGSKAPTVRQNYIAYRLLLQMEDVEDISLENVEEKFSVLFLSLRSAGTQAFLGLDLDALPNKARTPVPKAKVSNLKEYARWLFGDGNQTPLVRESRLVDKFGEILESRDAVDYLRRSDQPSFESAYKIAGGGEAENLLLLQRAADNIEEALSTIQHHLKSRLMAKAVHRLGVDALTLLDKFPRVRQAIDEERSK